MFISSVSDPIEVAFRGVDPESFNLNPNRPLIDFCLTKIAKSPLPHLDTLEFVATHISKQNAQEYLNAAKECIKKNFIPLLKQKLSKPAVIIDSIMKILRSEMKINKQEAERSLVDFKTLLLDESNQLTLVMKEYAEFRFAQIEIELEMRESETLSQIQENFQRAIFNEKMKILGCHPSELENKLSGFRPAYDLMDLNEQIWRAEISVEKGHTAPEYLTNAQKNIALALSESEPPYNIPLFYDIRIVTKLMDIIWLETCLNGDLASQTLSHVKEIAEKLDQGSATLFIAKAEAKKIKQPYQTCLPSAEETTKKDDHLGCFLQLVQDYARNAEYVSNGHAKEIFLSMKSIVLGTDVKESENYCIEDPYVRLQRIEMAIQVLKDQEKILLANFAKEFLLKVEALQTDSIDVDLMLRRKEETKKILKHLNNANDKLKIGEINPLKRKYAEKLELFWQAKCHFDKTRVALLKDLLEIDLTKLDKGLWIRDAQELIPPTPIPCAIEVSMLVKNILTT